MITREQALHFCRYIGDSRRVRNAFRLVLGVKPEDLGWCKFDRLLGTSTDRAELVESISNEDPSIQFRKDVQDTKRIGQFFCALGDHLISYAEDADSKTPVKTR